MNIFETKHATEQSIEARSREFVLMANAVMSKLAGEAGDRSFLTSYYGFVGHTSYSEYDEWVDNPHFNPDLPHTPENIEKRTGFNKMPVAKKVVNIHCTELNDQYDDWDPDGKFSITNIPFELWDTGSAEEIEAFITERFGEEAARNKRNLLHSKYVPLFEFSPGKLIQIAGILADCGDSPYSHIDEIIAKIEALNEEA